MKWQRRGGAVGDFALRMLLPGAGVYGLYRSLFDK
jgi:hypothetical protein